MAALSRPCTGSSDFVIVTLSTVPSARTTSSSSTSPWILACIAAAVYCGFTSVSSAGSTTPASWPVNGLRSGAAAAPRGVSPAAIRSASPRVKSPVITALPRMIDRKVGDAGARDVGARHDRARTQIHPLIGARHDGFDETGGGLRFRQADLERAATLETKRGQRERQRRQHRRRRAGDHEQEHEKGRDETQSGHVRLLRKLAKA